MKSKDKTNKKGHENTIGKIIYGFLLFMPLLAIAVTCAYAIFNKNAYQSYADYEYNIDQKLTISNLNDAIIGQEYTMTTQNVDFNGTYNTTSYMIEFENANWTTPNNAVYFTIGGSYAHNSAYSFTYYDNNKQFILYTRLNQANIYNFVLKSIYQPSTSAYTSSLNGAELITYQLIQEQGKLSDVFYYSIDKVEQSPLFSWSKDSVIYTGLHNTCLSLNITSTFIPMLLTYWLNISVIYYLYDIILIILNVFHRKIHELEESI